MACVLAKIGAKPSAMKTWKSARLCRCIVTVHLRLEFKLIYAPSFPLFDDFIQHLHQCLIRHAENLLYDVRSSQHKPYIETEKLDRLQLSFLHFVQDCNVTVHRVPWHPASIYSQQSSFSFSLCPSSPLFNPSGFILNTQNYHDLPFTRSDLQ